MIKKRKHSSRLKITLLFVFIAVLLTFFFSYEYINEVYKNKVYPKEYNQIVEKYAEKYGIEENFLYAIIKTESSFDTNAVSVDEARGLMQVTEETFEWLSTKMEDTDGLTHTDLHDPEIGIMYGSFFVSYLLDEFGDKSVVAAAYHAGRGITNKWLLDEQYSKDGTTLSNIPYSATAHYVDKVMTNYERYNKLYG